MKIKNRFNLFVAVMAAGIVVSGFSGKVLAVQTDTHGIHAVPCPAKVMIDGQLDDWDLSGKVLMCYDVETMQDIYSLQVAMMYDAENLYVSAHWKDRTPMGNSHDPRYSGDRGWAGDCLQLRIKTDLITHLTSWYYAPTQSPAIQMTYGIGVAKPFGGPEKLLNKTQGWKLEEGAEMAFVKDADGKGYVQELKLPWKLITTGKKYKPGDEFQCGVEPLWGEADVPIHRYVDNLAEGATSREFFWSSVSAWGSVWLDTKNNLKLPEPAYLKAARAADGTGPVDINYELPKEARVTLAIDDNTGRRVRNLIAARPRQAGKNTEHWDGLDDNGLPVQPGDYRFKAIYHDGIHVSYVMSFASPGNPSWDTPDGTGAFYGDHSCPLAAAAGGDTVALTCPMGESGKALIGLDLDGQRKWGLHARLYGENIALATDGKTLYVATILCKDQRVRANGGRTFIWRCEMATGKYAPWSRKDAKGAEMLDLDVVPDGPDDDCRGLALFDGRLAVLLATERRVLILDGKTGDIIKELKDLPAGLTAIAYTPGGELRVTTEDTLFSLDGDTGKATQLAKGLVAAFGMTTDSLGNIYVSQRGTQQNICIFDATGKKLREVGKLGGRPVHGPFIDQGMRNPGRLAIDSKGRLWVPELTFNPKRTSVWSPDGKFLKDFVGTLKYCSAGAINPYDATMAFADSTVYQIDLATGSSRPVYSMESRGLPDEIFSAGFDSHIRIVRHGRDTLLYSSDRSGSVYCILQRDGQWRIASAVGFVPKNKLRDVYTNYEHPLMAAHAGESFSWADRNGDGLVQPEELVFSKFVADGKPVADVRGCFWGVLPETDGTIVYSSVSTDSLVKLPIIGYTECGAPRYELATAKFIKITGGFSKVSLTSVDHLMGGSEGRVYLNQPSPLTVVGKEGKILGTYPSPVSGVHGSHKALSARPGYLVGPNTVTGTVDLGGEIGEVFDLNGNLGEHYLFTSDALWIQSLLKDTRGYSEVPEKAVRGMPMDGITAGGESFGGQLVRTPDGNTYLVIGITDARVLQVTGLESIRRLAGAFSYTPGQFVQAKKFVEDKAAQSHQPKQLLIRKAATPPLMDGKLDKWTDLVRSDVPVADIVEDGDRRFGRAALRYDAQNLYVAWHVLGPGAMRNGGQDERQLFKTGDCVDLMFGPTGTPNGAGNLRLLISKLGKETVAELYQKVIPGGTDKERVGFSSPWQTIYFAGVTRPTDVKAFTGSAPGGYFVEATIPWKVLGIEPKSGLKLRGDLGILFGDSGGTTTVSRKYWSNKETGQVNDVPSEADLTPAMWGNLELE